MAICFTEPYSRETLRYWVKQLGGTGQAPDLWAIDIARTVSGLDHEKTTVIPIFGWI
jgi:hypothetical protein